MQGGGRKSFPLAALHWVKKKKKMGWGWGHTLSLSVPLVILEDAWAENWRNRAPAKESPCLNHKFPASLKKGPASHRRPGATKLRRHPHPPSPLIDS